NVGAHVAAAPAHQYGGGLKADGLAVVDPRPTFRGRKEPLNREQVLAQLFNRGASPGAVLTSDGRFPAAFPLAQQGLALRGQAPTRSVGTQYAMFSASPVFVQSRGPGRSFTRP